VASKKKQEKPLAWLDGGIKTPPFTLEARLEAGYNLRRIQQGELLEMPHSRQMPDIGAGCHELRINDKKKTWRIVYHIGDEDIAILDVFEKKTNKTSKRTIKACQKRLGGYLAEG
jgi:phage-related protein